MWSGEGVPSFVSGGVYKYCTIDAPSGRDLRVQRKAGTLPGEALCLKAAHFEVYMIEPVIYNPVLHKAT